MTRKRHKITIHFWWFSLAPAPENWYTVYPLCAGKFQSPVNIVTKKTKKKSYSPLKVTFDNPCGLVTGQIVNGGHAPAFNVDNSKGSAKLSGGPLECDEYTLQQFHFHFGCENSRGSEHTVNNKSYAAQVLHNSIHFLHVHQRVFSKRDCLMLGKVTLLILTLGSIFLFTNWPSLFYSQLHLVFYNNKYDTFSNAVDKPDGLAVLGVLVSVNISNLSLYCLCSF